MGSWGSGNFENDAALDMVGEIADVAGGEIQGFLDSDDPQVEDLDDVMACIEVVLVLSERCGAAPTVKPTDARTLQRKVLDAYDGQIDGLDPDEDYKVERRKVIEQTLDRLREVSEKFWKDE